MLSSKFPRKSMRQTRISLARWRENMFYHNKVHGYLRSCCADRQIVRLRVEFDLAVRCMMQRGGPLPL